eukprot:1500443-Rhodomonas_salina.1
MLFLSTESLSEASSDTAAAHRAPSVEQTHPLAAYSPTRASARFSAACTGPLSGNGGVSVAELGE